MRSASGRPADWSSADFWDWLTAPLVAMAFDRQLVFSSPRRYSDSGWVDAVGMSG
jgi:hypothetical protein